MGRVTSNKGRSWTLSAVLLGIVAWLLLGAASSTLSWSIWWIELVGSFAVALALVLAMTMWLVPRGRVSRRR